MPRELTLKKKYKKRKQWKNLFFQKLKLLRIYHRVCSSWFKKMLHFDQPIIKQAMRYFRKTIHIEKYRYTPLRRKKPPEQKKPYFMHKFNKKFRLFKKLKRYKTYVKYQYQLKLLQKHFVDYLKTSVYLYKQLKNFYTRFGFWSRYEKFFYVMHHRVVIILKKLRYFSIFTTAIATCIKLIYGGAVLINGKKIRNLYSCIWINDNIGISYRLYYFEWYTHRYYKLLKTRKWDAVLDPFAKKTLYKPLLVSRIKRKKLRMRRLIWCICSRYIPTSIIIRPVSAKWQRSLMPRVYNFVNLQIISEFLPYRIC